MRHPCVAHYRGIFLPRTERFIYNLVTCPQRYRTLVLTERRAHEAEMPCRNLVSRQRARQPLCAWLHDRLLTRLRGHSPLFARASREHDARLLHAHFGFDALRILPLARFLSLPLITSFYGYDSAPQHRQRFEGLFHQGAAFIAEGRCMKSRLAALGCPAEKIEVIPIGLTPPAEELWHTPLRKRSYRLLFAGRFVEKKGLTDLLAAMRPLRAAASGEIRLDVVGEQVPVSDRDYRALADELGVADLVTFHGMRPLADLQALIRTCDLIVQPSVVAADGDAEGGAPTVLTLAQAAGLPAVATRHCDIPDIVLDGRTGLLCPEHDVASLAAAIRTLLEDAPRRTEMSRAAREHIRGAFSLETQVAETERLYDRILPR